MVNFLQAGLWAYTTIVVCMVGGSVVLHWLLSIDRR